MATPDPDTLPLGPFRFGPAGVRVAGRPTLEAFAGPLRFALWCQKGSAWWIGDLLNSGDARFGETFSQICEGQISADQLQRFESVARRVPKENRRPNLSWSCHAAVARLPPPHQRRLLEKAERHGWNSSVLARRARAELTRLRAAGELSADEPATDDDGRRTEPAFRDTVGEDEEAGEPVSGPVPAGAAG